MTSRVGVAFDVMSVTDCLLWKSKVVCRRPYFQNYIIFLTLPFSHSSVFRCIVDNLAFCIPLMLMGKRYSTVSCRTAFVRICTLFRVMYYVNSVKRDPVVFLHQLSSGVRFEVIS